MAPRKSSALAVHERGIIATTSAATSFAQYTEQRDLMLATPFAHNTTLASCGAAFTVLTVSEGAFASLRDKDIMEPAWLYLCRSQADWSHTDETTGELVSYPAGELFVLKLSKGGGIRERDALTMKDLLRADGEVPNVALQEYQTKRKGFSNSHGLVSAAKWAPLARKVEE